MEIRFTVPSQFYFSTTKILRKEEQENPPIFTTTTITIIIIFYFFFFFFTVFIFVIVILAIQFSGWKDQAGPAGGWELGSRCWFENVIVLLLGMGAMGSLYEVVGHLLQELESGPWLWCSGPCSLSLALATSREFDRDYQGKRGG